MEGGTEGGREGGKEGGKEVRRVWREGGWREGGWQGGKEGVEGGRVEGRRRRKRWGGRGEGGKRRQGSQGGRTEWGGKGRGGRGEGGREWREGRRNEGRRRKSQRREGEGGRWEGGREQRKDEWRGRRMRKRDTEKGGDRREGGREGGRKEEVAGTFNGTAPPHPPKWLPVGLSSCKQLQKGSCEYWMRDDGSGNLKLSSKALSIHPDLFSSAALLDLCVKLIKVLFYLPQWPWSLQCRHTSQAISRSKNIFSPLLDNQKERLQLVGFTQFSPSAQYTNSNPVSSPTPKNVLPVLWATFHTTD